MQSRSSHQWAWPCPTALGREPERESGCAQWPWCCFGPWCCGSCGTTRQMQRNSVSLDEGNKLNRDAVRHALPPLPRTSLAVSCQGCRSYLWLTLLFVGTGHQAFEVGALPTGQCCLHQDIAQWIQYFFSSWHQLLLKQGSSSSAHTCKYVSGSGSPYFELIGGEESLMVLFLISFFFHIVLYLRSFFWWLRVFLSQWKLPCCINPWLGCSPEAW